MSDSQRVFSRRHVLQSLTVLGTGVAVGAAAGRRANVPLAGAASTQVADPTETRRAELAELDDLRTQVAQPVVCTPAATVEANPSPTATEVPLSTAGVALPYLDIWTITPLGIAPAPGSQEPRPAGQFMQVNLSVGHSAGSGQILPYGDFTLTDSAGRIAVVDQEVNRAVFGNGWLLAISPGVEEIRGLIFDVPADAGDAFTLESNADPTFRVALEIEERG